MTRIQRTALATILLALALLLSFALPQAWSTPPTWYTTADGCRTTVASGALNNTTSPVTFTVTSGSPPIVLSVTSALIQQMQNSIYAPLSTKGDLYTYSTTPDRLAVGTNGKLLVADSTKDTGLDWVSAIPNGTTATTQSASDNSTKVATTAYVEAAVAAGTGTFDPDTHMPWVVEIDPLFSSVSNVGWNTVYCAGTNLPTTGGQEDTDDLMPYNAASETDNGNQNNEITFYATLAAGTWDFRLVHYKYSAAGIYTVSVDGSSIGTIDGYTAGSSIGVTSTISGFAVATTGRATVNLKMVTKNASSSAYNGAIFKIILVRTL